MYNFTWVTPGVTWTHLYIYIYVVLVSMHSRCACLDVLLYFFS